MSKLPPTATEEEIEEEMMFVHILRQSLDAVEDPEETMMKLQEYDDILQYLATLLDQKRGLVRPQTPLIEPSTDGLLRSGQSINLPSRSAPSQSGYGFDGANSPRSPLPQSIREKRRNEVSHEPRKVRRTSDSDTSPSSVNTPLTIDSLDQDERELQQRLGSKIAPSGENIARRIAQSRRLLEERERVQQERNMAIKADEELARQFYQSTPQPQSSQRTTQTFLGRNGGIKRKAFPLPADLDAVAAPSDQFHPVKDEPGANPTFTDADAWLSDDQLGLTPYHHTNTNQVEAEQNAYSSGGYMNTMTTNNYQQSQVPVKNEHQSPWVPQFQMSTRTPGAYPSSDEDDLLEISPAEFAASASSHVSPGKSRAFSSLIQPPPTSSTLGGYPGLVPPTNNMSFTSGVHASQQPRSYLQHVPNYLPSITARPADLSNPASNVRTGVWGQAGMGNQNPFGMTQNWLQDQNSLVFDFSGDFGAGNYDYPLDLDNFPEVSYGTDFQSRLHARGWDYMLNDPAQTKEEIEKLLENIRPDEELPPELRIDTPIRMKLPLMEHQKLGLAWLKKQEEGTNKGGILADDMGLGKTIQALALMVSRASTVPVLKTNLIVAPLALMRQWEREIKEKIDPRNPLSVFVYHGQAKKRATYAKLSTFDVVLTTFGSLATEVGQKIKYEEARKSNQPAVAPCLTLIGENSRWYRVIIDEAQCIKNHNTKTAQGAYLLASTYRLCMTGTPMMNGVHELYSLIHFLKIPPYNEMQRFNRDFKNPLQKNGTDRAKDRAMQALQALLRAVLLRRTKKSTIDGKAILNLPERVTMVDHAIFSEDEQAFYKHLENRTALQVNKYLKAGTIGKNYSNILVLLLRLRQACCHPHLIKNHGVAGNEDVSAEDMVAFVKRLEEGVVTMIKENKGSFECPICYDGIENPTFFFPCGHDVCAECFGILTDPARAIENGRETADAKCPECRNQLDAKKVFNYAAFRRVHAQEGDVDFDDLFAKEDQAEGPDTDSEEDDSDSDDANSQGDLRDFIVADDEEEEEVDDDDVDDDDIEESDEVEVVKKEKKGKSKKLQKSRKSKGKDRSKDKNAQGKDPKKKHKSLAELKKEGMRNASAKKRYLKRLRRDYISSAKLDKLMEILDSIRSKDPTEKTIIFSQFTSLLDLAEVPIDIGGYRSRRYDGSMSATLRNDAVNDFMDKPEITVMLVSLKAGNAGLNLTKASQVIILDPFWNPYIEEQAIDRAHRIGQTREVTVHRILVEETVEDRIVALQDKKRDQISKALDEKAGQSVSRLGRQELAYLFGIDRTLER